MFALALLAPPAAGQQISSPYDFLETSQGARAFVSYIFADRGVIGVGPASGMAAGVGYNLRISGPFEFDVKASFLPTTRTVAAAGPSNPATLTRSLVIVRSECEDT